MIGKALGHYQVSSQLGKGGMGEVYAADDVNLNRKVALKFLPEAFAGDPERMARFEREARLLASLNHPNIAAIYGLEQAEGKRFIVMELVEGETLAQRIGKGALRMEDALFICRQIAEGLEAAHEKGVIHRDLKPANVMITDGDKVKILDFGLAKALSDETQTIDSSQSPTLTEAMTRPGVILGTAAYISPEQAKGKSVDKRADIWAFGCILYECLRGKRAFEGETVTETLAAVLTKEPDWEKVPAKVQPLVRRCVEKDPKKRLRDIGDAFALLETAPASASLKQRSWLAWSAAVLFFIAAGALALMHFHEESPSVEPVCFQIPFPDKFSTDDYGAFAVSPDGHTLAFRATSQEGVHRLWLRALNSWEARPLPDIELSRDTSFFWSPDSHFLGFNAGGKLKKINLAGGPPEPICDLSPASFSGGSWNRQGVIVFGTPEGVMRVSAAGGVISPVTKTNHVKHELAHESPAFLPDGRHFLYLCRSTTREHSGIRVGDLEAKPEEQEASRLVSTGFGSVYVSYPGSSPGWLLFLREQTLMAQPFDDAKRLLAGTPQPVSEIGVGTNFPFFSASANGILVFKRGGSNRITWIDRYGQELSGTANQGKYSTFDLSGDASQLVVSITLPNGQNDLWVVDLLRGPKTRLTSDEAKYVDPRWSPDGRHVIFNSLDDFPGSPYQVSLPGSKPVQVFKFSGNRFALDDLSPDGSHLLYHDFERPELWAIPLVGDQKPLLVTRSLSGSVNQAQFSPDSRWIAYNTNESGRYEVKVVAFPPASDKWQISTAGGM
jgi:serine/threonine protein kinase